MGSRLESNSSSVRKRIANHTFDDEDGEEYEGSKFGGFSDYFRRKKIKLQNLDADIRAQAGDKPQIFKGIVAHVNGYTQPSLNDLHTLIVEHGGGFLQYLDGKTTVTHIIASALTPKKAVEFRKYRIVKPAWVVESIAAGKLLPWNNFRVVDEGEKQKVLAFDGGSVMSSAPNRAKGYRDQSDNSWYTDQLRGSQSGEPSGTFASTPTPSVSRRSRFSRQRLPTPDDDIEDLPPCHQPERLSFENEPQIQNTRANPKKLVTPPKTSPSVNPQREGADHISDIDDADEHDSLYKDPTPPPKSHGKEHVPDNVNAKSVLDNRQLTAEEHNAILLRDPKIRKSTVVDPNFLEQYYRESRLHHLSTWKADLKSQLQALANEKSATQTLKLKRPPGARRYILHVDFDSFFAAVSLKNHPQYKDKPAAVAHGNGSGSEIASCNYPARKFGVKNGMWMKRAQELCPELKILPYDFPAYEEHSRAFYDSILAVGGIVQSVSIDEALIDVSNLCISAGGGDGVHVSEGNIYREQAKAEDIARMLRDQVKTKTECNVSVGIGSNILLAKVALRKAKPAGQYQIKPEEVLDFIGNLQVQDLPGVAYSIGGKLEELGIKYVKDIREFSKERIVQALGPKTGEKLWEYSRGIDRQEVGEQVVRKSVSAEVNWGVRFENQEQVDEFLGNLCGEFQKRLLKEKVKGKQFTMKVMRRSPDAPLDPPKHLGHGKCDTYNKSVVLGVATNAKELLTKEALSILKGFGFSPGELRGIGMQMTKLEVMKSATDGNLDGSQRRLQFKVGNPEPKKPRQIVQAVEADPIQDDPETPKKKNKTVTDDEHIAFGPAELNRSTPSRRPLNMLGTQFIMPTQVDPKVLAELPEDIRSKLLRQSRQSSPTPAGRPVPARSTPFALTALPAQSQLDPEILAALPPDVRAEVLSQYAASATPRSPSGRKTRPDQTILSQSPRKNRIIGIPAKRPIVAPVKRGRGRPPRSAQLAAAALASAKDKLGRTLTQANFISIKNPARDNSREASLDVPGGETAIKPKEAVKGKGQAEVTLDTADLGLDAEFLLALPPDLREEIIQEKRRQRAKALTRAKANQQPPPQPQPKPPSIQVPRPKIPKFTKKKLHRAKDLRAAMKDWVVTFADDGPYVEDVDALVKYLGRVVCEERDMAKAVGVVGWLEWVVGDGEDEVEGFAKKHWDDAIERVKEGLQKAAQDRGLGSIAFG
ncbi:DNA repair protein [Periconia macrospinosa]|uniref:DNA repair protein REV1 n=1 Tax=Periconia macrospinosa TaxID=97972 RepID=A0A2V1DUC4_9PLEO|nr:DNA repair protein [Periconia macrospinosa]